MHGPDVVSLSNLVPLMYRARWLRSFLSGEVTSREESPDGAGWETGSLLAAPGGRYRAETVDEDGDRDLVICDGRTGGVPFGELLIPSWLLAAYDLAVAGRVGHVGRAAYVVRATPRGGRSRTGWPSDSVTALVDAELGILLRYEEASPTGRARVIEFTSLRVDPADSADPLLFTQPADGDPGQDNAGPDEDDPEPALEPARIAPELSDEQVNLLYRTALGPQRFAAELRERADQKTIRQQGEEALAATRLGRRTRWLWENPPASIPDQTDWRARVTVAMPGCYRIDMLTDPGARAACIASDGERMWRVYPDRVAVGPAGPLPPGIGSVLDPSWLLDGYQLSTQGTVTVGGRPGLRIAAVPASPVLRQGLQPGVSAAADQIEVIVDAELGITLRQVCSFQGLPLVHSELAGVTTDIDPEAFAFRPPPGARIIHGGRLLADTGLSPGEIAWYAATAAPKLAIEIARRWISSRR